MRNIVNVRIYVFCACMLALGVALGYALKFYVLSFLWVLLVIPLAALIFIPFFLKRRDTFPLIYLAVTIIFFISGSYLSIAQMNTYERQEADLVVEQSVHGTIIDIGYTDSGNYLLINNLTMNDIEVAGSLKLYLNDGDEGTIGYRVFFYGYVNDYNLFNYGELNYNAYNNIKYYSSSYTTFRVTKQFSPFHAIRSQINDILFENLDRDTAALCYGMMIGNTDRMDNESLTSFRYGGISHIFAVSGLHVGIIFGIISTILSRFKTPKVVKTIVSLSVMFCYCGVCGFTLSSIRAAVMCSVSSIVRLFRFKWDGLNNLAVAVIVLLLINPLSLFSVGFQLSVCAVGGIHAYSKFFSHLMRKLPEPKNEFIFVSLRKMYNGISMSLGAQLGTIPILLAHFGYLSVAGIFLNIIVIPIMSAFFTVMFTGVLLSLIIQPLAPYILTATTLPIQATASILIGSGFRDSIVSGFGAGIFVPLYFLCILTTSDKINLHGIKQFVSISLACLVMFTSVMASTYLPISGYKIIASGYGGGGAVLLKSSKGSVLIVSDYVNPSRIYTFLNKNYALKLDAVIFLGEIDNILYFDDIGADCSDGYSYILNIPIQPYENATMHFEQYFSICGIDFEFVDKYTLTAEVDGVNVGICSDEVKLVECDLLISVEENSYCDTKLEVYFGLKGYSLNTYDYGSITYLAKKSKLTLLNILPNR